MYIDALYFLQTVDATMRRIENADTIVYRR